MHKGAIDGITVFAEKRDYANAERVVGDIYRSSHRIHDALGIQEAQNIDLYIYPDRKALHRKTIGFVGWILPDWYTGRNSSDSVGITSPSEPGPGPERTYGLMDERGFYPLPC